MSDNFDDPQQAKPNNLKRVLWLASYPKSGNTWLRFVLDSYAADREVPINTYYGHYASGDLHVGSYQTVCPWPLNTAPQYVWVALRVPALLHMMAARQCENMALKTHHANIEMFGMALIPPELTIGAVYIVRDPRDVAISWANHASVSIDRAIEFMGRDQATIANQQVKLGHYVASWSQHVSSWTADNEDIETTVVRYEDLLDDPHEEFSRVIKQTHFEYDSDRLSRAIERCSFDRLRAAEDEDGFKEKRGGDHFFRVGKSGQWRDRLTPGQIHRIEEQHCELMMAMGYELVEVEHDPLAEGVV